jgi:predicted MFS family arabinose efflux permease
MKGLHFRLAALAILIAAFAVGMAVLLIVFKVQSTHLELRHGRFDMVAREVDRLVESSLSLGVPFDELPRLQAALDRQNSFDRDIRSIDVVKLNGRISYSSDATRIGQLAPAAWREQWSLIATTDAKKPTNDVSTWRIVDITRDVLDDAIAGTALANAFGEREGYVAVRYTLEATQRAQQQVRSAMLPFALKAFAVTAILIYALLLLFAWLFERQVRRATAVFVRHGAADDGDTSQRIPEGWAPFLTPFQQQLHAARLALSTWQAELDAAAKTTETADAAATLASDRVSSATRSTATQPQQPSPARAFIIGGLVSIVFVIAGAIAALGAAGRTHAEATLAYETMRKSETVARSLAASFERAVELKIPLEEIPGISARFEETRAAHPELSRISLTIAGEPRFVVRTAGTEGLVESVVESAPVLSASGTSELLDVAIDPRFIARTLRELWLDFVVIMVVAVFVTLELIYFFGGPMIVLPLRSLTTSFERLSSGVLGGPIPAHFGGALATLAQAARARQESVLSLYRDAHARLRTHLHARRAQRVRPPLPDATTPRAGTNADRLRQAVHGLRAIRDGFGLRLRPEKRIVLDPSHTLGSMRAPFFLLLFAEDLSRSFLPVFAGTMQLGGLPLAREWVVGLPIILFMLIVALSQPVLGGWCDRVGRRRAFLLAAATAAVAHLLSSQATTLQGLLAWRSAAGLAWAVAFVAAQGVVLDNTDKSTRAEGLASFVTVIMVSMVCGPSIGGLLADGIGQRDTFVVAATLCVLAFAIGWRDLPRGSAQPMASGAPNTRSSGFPIQALSNPNFLGLLLLAAAPAKLILVAYCFYLIPLYLNASGSSSATAGRVIMIYSVLMVLLVPVAAAQLERLRAQYGSVVQRWFVLAGLLLSAVAGFAIAVPHGLWGAVLLVTLLGIAQALSISPQAAMVPELGRDAIARYGESAVYGCYRLVERIGNAIGPVAAAALLHVAGYEQTFMALAVFVFACAALFAWRYVWHPSNTVNAKVRS